MSPESAKLRSKVMACYDNDRHFSDKRQIVSQSSPPPSPSLLDWLLTDLRERRDKRHCHSKSCLASPMPISLQSQSPEQGSGPSAEVILPHPPSPEPWPCDKPTQHQRAFLALRGILSLPASTQPSLPARCRSQPEGWGTSGLDSLGGSPWPWDGGSCLLAPPCPMGHTARWGSRRG